MLFCAQIEAFGKDHMPSEPFVRWRMPMCSTRWEQCVAVCVCVSYLIVAPSLCCISLCGNGTRDAAGEGTQGHQEDDDAREAYAV